MFTRRPVRCLLESNGDIHVIFDDNGEHLILDLLTSGLSVGRHGGTGNPNDFSVYFNDNVVPPLQVGEIIWCFCIGCGMDHLGWPGECTCGNKTYEKLGTMQGAKWRHIRFGNNFKHKAVNWIWNKAEYEEAVRKLNKLLWGI